MGIIFDSCAANGDKESPGGLRNANETISQLKKILIIAGTRPEVIKLAPVIRAIRLRPTDFESVYCCTGQHREMVAQANEVFDLVPDIDLALMAPGQSLSSLTALLFRAIDDVIEESNPDVIIVQGDTTSAFVGAMCGFYRRLEVGHVEAGLRTGDIYSPFPEELNRSVIGKVATFHFAPTQGAAENLINEGCNPASVFVTGNTVVDALNWVKRSGRLSPTIEISPPLAGRIRTNKFILVTSHRRESFGGGLAATCNALLRLTREFPGIDIVFPVHLNPKVKGPVYELLGASEQIHLLPPVSYPTLLWLMSECYIIISDSGGIQEEAPSFEKPLLILRETTERPEAVESGCARLVGTDEIKVFEQASILLNDRNVYESMCVKKSPFGDGDAGEKIAQILALEKAD